MSRSTAIVAFETGMSWFSDMALHRNLPEKIARLSSNPDPSVLPIGEVLFDALLLGIGISQPVGNAVAELFGIFHRKHIAQGIMRGYPVLQTLLFHEPGFFVLAKFFSRRPIVRATNNSAKDDEQYTRQLVLPLSVDFWVFNT